MAEGNFAGNITPHETVDTRIEDWLKGLGISPDGTTVIKLPDHRVIIGVDFGTTNSGYAFMIESTDEIRVNSIWAGQNQTYSKVPTIILLDENEKFKNFGLAAQTEYTKIEDNEKAKKLLYFDRFKMNLYSADGPQKLSRNMTIEAANGTKVSALRVFSEVLQQMWKSARDKISKASFNLTNLQTSDVLWVITVPAIWSDEAKAFMRLAALEAGLITNQSENRLLFSLEPEAASIFCLRKESEAFERTLDLSRQQLGEQHLIADAGGGTVDITVHEIDEVSGLKEVQRASGGPWGGHSINLAIWMLLREICGPENFDALKEIAPQVCVEQGVLIEAAKTAWDFKSESGLRLPVYQGLVETLEDLGTSIRSAVKTYNAKYSQDVKYNFGYLTIGKRTTRQLFDKTVDNIICHIRTVLEDQKQANEASPEQGSKVIRRLYLVGGFSISTYLQHRVTEAFEDGQLKVLVPTDSSIIVMQGAVLFGKYPSIIKQRIARLTYGEEMRMEFRKNIDPPDKKVDGDRCDGRFMIFVHKDDAISLGSVVRKIGYPVRSGQKCIDVKLYSSPSKEVQYTSEDRWLATIPIVFPEAYADIADGKIETVVCFGFTEMHTLVIHHKTLKNVAKKVQFLSD